MKIFRTTVEKIAFICQDLETPVDAFIRQLDYEDYRVLPRLIAKNLKLWPKTTPWLLKAIGALGDLRGDLESWFEHPVTDPSEPYYILGDGTIRFSDADTTGFS